MFLTSFAFKTPYPRTYYRSVNIGVKMAILGRRDFFYSGNKVIQQYNSTVYNKYTFFLTFICGICKVTALCNRHENTRIKYVTLPVKIEVTIKIFS